MFKCRALYRVIHNSVKHVRKLADVKVEWRHLSTRRLSGSLQRRARVSQSKLATKVDRTHRKRRWRVNAVATPVTGFKPVRLFLLWGLWRTLSLCLHSPLISRFSQPYHRCCGSGRPWYADTRIERGGLSHRCLPYYQRWTHWASVKCVKKIGELFSLSAWELPWSFW